MSLTEVSYYIRKMLPFGILGLLVLFILFYAFKILFVLTANRTQTNIVYTQLFPGEKIASPLIPSAVPSTNFKFTMDTIEGKPVTATSSARIFVLPPTSTTFGYREKILLMAKTLGFDTDNTKYRLEDKEAIFEEANQKLSVDISNFNFTYQYQIQNSPDIFKNTQIPTEDEIIQRASAFLQKVDRYPEDFARSKPTVTYFTYNPTTTQMTVSDTPDQTSNMVEVDFFRPDIDATPSNLSTVTSKFPNSQNYVAMVFNDQDVKIIKSQVRFFESSADQIGIYPLKTGDLAWQQLQAGKGLVISSMPGQTNVTIKKMFLAYYDPDVYQPYLEPVYVFVGDNSFVGYVPAVQDSLLAK